MRLFTWLQTRTSNLPARARSPRRAAARRFRPRLEMLEDRALLTAYTAATATDLIADINAANKSNGTNTIMLTAPSTSPYVFLAANNHHYREWEYCQPRLSGHARCRRTWPTVRRRQRRLADARIRAVAKRHSSGLGRRCRGRGHPKSGHAGSQRFGGRIQRR